MKLTRLLPLGLLLTLLFATVSAPAQTKTHRVLFALTSGDEVDWKLMLGNIRNLLSGVAPDAIEVEVVSFGPGIAFIQKGSSVEAEITALQEKHVQFMACENSMRMRKLTIADLVVGAHPVPSGIVEVVTKQEQGWTYIKAGR